MHKSIAIIQPNYIPWKGYFDFIAEVDEFVLLDDVQYTRRDWRNRNRIKTPRGLEWLSIPIQSKGNYQQLVSETQIRDQTWVRSHLDQIRQNYRQAKCFSEVIEWLANVYEGVRSDKLVDINLHFIREICKFLKIDTPIISSSSIRASGRKSDKLLEICRFLGARRYVSGPSARGYLEVDKFKGCGIEVSWMTYENYPEYPQLHGSFEHGVSVLDLLLNVGRESPRYMKLST